MAYRDNVQELCDSLGLPNPVREEDLSIIHLTFLNEAKPRKKLVVDVRATDMNRAGRLFLQSCFPHAGTYPLEPIRARAEEFFTDELWFDCNAEKRTLVYGIKKADFVRIFTR